MVLIYRTIREYILGGNFSNVSSSCYVLKKRPLPLDYHHLEVQDYYYSCYYYYYAPNFLKVEGAYCSGLVDPSVNIHDWKASFIFLGNYLGDA